MNVPSPVPKLEANLETNSPGTTGATVSVAKESPTSGPSRLKVCPLFPQNLRTTRKNDSKIVSNIENDFGKIY